MEKPIVSHALPSLWQVMSHILNISGEAREECVRGALKLRLWEIFCPRNLFYLTLCTKRQVCVLHAGCQPRWVSLGPYVKKMPRLCMPDPEAGSGKPAYNFPHNTSQCLPGYSLQRSAEHLKGKNALSSLTLNGCTGKK